MESTDSRTICSESTANTSIGQINLADLMGELQKRREEREQAQRKPGEFTVRDYQEQNKISHQTAMMQVRTLEAEGLIERCGSIKIGRNTSVLYRKVQQG